MVFSNKRKLKGKKDKMFIAENFAQYKYELIRQLNGMEKITRFILSGHMMVSILEKEKEKYKIKVIKNKSDIDKME